jgi:hypothetical protein
MIFLTKSFSNTNPRRITFTIIHLIHEDCFAVTVRNEMKSTMTVLFKVRKFRYPTPWLRISSHALQQISVHVVLRLLQDLFKTG